MTTEPIPAAGPLVTPTVEAWRAMRQDERERFLERVNASLSDPRVTMSEGRPHKKAKTRALDRLGLHFRSAGRAVYLAEEMAVLYPGELAFSPDVLAVADQAAEQATRADARAAQQTAQATAAMEGLRSGLLAMLEARGLTCSEAQRARVQACTEVATLQRWLLRAVKAGSAAEALDEGS